MTWLGIATTNGTRLDGLDHIAQSVRDILTTAVGSRLMRRAYGSNIPDLIDQPMNGATLLRLSAAAVVALRRWEPRIRLTRVRFTVGSAGALTVDMDIALADQSAAKSLTLALGAA